VSLPHCYRFAFERLIQDSEQVVATFTNGETLTSDVLISCDGAASKVRACVFGDGVVNYTGRVAFRALLPMAKVPASITKMPYAMFVGVGCCSIIHCGTEPSPKQRATVPEQTLV
jgi:2-polyprenyl-6-methoxyphenol hydroxylase-like FAD-dependent oxidoreductase